ncbi:type III pantothenate kinase [Flavobacterium sp.]|uniref:type III pantothenate kinase n=1 Tax=Flavobacterium sp. TaxID=239 RepID=UPI0039E3B4C8
MLLAIDVGNTRIKYAVFEQDTLVEAAFFEKETLQSHVEKILKTYAAITDLAVASVGSVGKDAFLSFENIRIHFISHQNRFPFVNRYATPATLGIDRMVLAAGAVLRFPDQARLVIDAGTCITYDFVDAANQYLGGAISPGIRLRYEALHNFTARLPLLEKTAPKDFVGDSTAESIHSGVVQGMLHEIDGFINQYKERYPNFIIILTGGDADFLAKRLKNTIFAHSNFLLESLNQTFQYQIKND